MISVKGVLRKMLTQPAPNPRSTGTGETRIAASRTPITRARTDDATVSFRIQRNPVTYTSTLAGSEKTSIATLGLRGAPGTGHAQLVSLLTSRSGAGLPLLPSVSSQAFLYDPSAADAFRISL